MTSLKIYEKRLQSFWNNRQPILEQKIFYSILHSQFPVIEFQIISLGIMKEI